VVMNAVQRSFDSADALLRRASASLRMTLVG
jgi:hypothetical protein